MGLKTRIYAPRLYGDIDLGLEPSRIDTKGNRDWARMTFPGGHISGRPEQDVYTQSTGTTPNYVIGTRRIEYGRTFRYSRAGETFVTADSARLVKNGNFDPEFPAYADRDGFYGDLLNEALVTATYLDLEETTAGRIANFFQGAYVTTFADLGPTARNFTTYYVVWSDASTDTYTRIYLDHPVIQRISATNGIHLFRSPYSNVIDGQSAVSWASCVGRVLCGDVTINRYFWLQTAGPAWVACTQFNNPVNPGYNADKRDVYAWPDGTIQNRGVTGSLQRVGYVLAATVQGTGSLGGESFIMLQLE